VKGAYEIQPLSEENTAFILLVAFPGILNHQNILSPKGPHSNPHGQTKINPEIEEYYDKSYGEPSQLNEQ
jgi:hypothetical protein